MKRLFIILILAIMILPAINGQFTKIGGGAAFGTGYQYNNVKVPDYEKNLHKGPMFGIYLNGIYEFKLPIHVAPSFAFFIPNHNEEMSMETRVSSMMLDIDGHYVFNALDRFEFFALAGFNVHFTSLKWLGTESGDHDNAFGMNIGGGAYIKMTETLDLYGEAKYIISKYDQAMFRVGILLNLDWMIKHEKE